MLPFHFYTKKTYMDISNRQSEITSRQLSVNKLSPKTILQHITYCGIVLDNQNMGQTLHRDSLNKQGEGHVYQPQKKYFRYYQFYIAFEKCNIDFAQIPHFSNMKQRRITPYLCKCNICAKLMLYLSNTTQAGQNTALCCI